MSPTSLPKEFEDVRELQRMLKDKPESYWAGRGESMALGLFHEMSERVPAYQDFLSRHNFDPKSVKAISDFERVPLISKDNYLRKYPLEQLCWDGNLAGQQWVISTTSGSTGEPFYFPRAELQDEFYALSAELYLLENFEIDKKSTLYIDAFAMGAWIGGLFTYEAVHRVAQKGYSLSIITPGINKPEVINAVRKLGASYDQVIIGCYPPILRDIIDLGIEEGLDWGDYNLGVVFSAEGFGEEFRDYIAEHGKLANIHTSTLNHYGTVDLGTMSHETPLSIFARREGLKDKQLYSDMFNGVTKQPTLTQFVPEMFYFEEVDNGVVCSSYSGLPLARYDLKDRGGIISLDQLTQTFAKHGKDLDTELATVGLADKTWNLPFVYLYERSDFSVTFTGAQIYPEEIRRALLDPSVHREVTGKFTMIAGYDDDAQNFLEVNVELRKTVEPSPELEQSIVDLIVQRLLEENSEYRVLYGEYSTKLHPKVQFWPFGHEKHFSGRGKQQWVKK